MNYGEKLPGIISTKYSTQEFHLTLFHESFSRVRSSKTVAPPSVVESELANIKVNCSSLVLLVEAGNIVERDQTFFKQIINPTLCSWEHSVCKMVSTSLLNYSVKQNNFDTNIWCWSSIDVVNSLCPIHWLRPPHTAPPISCFTLCHQWCRDAPMRLSWTKPALSCSCREIFLVHVSHLFVVDFNTVRCLFWSIS